MTPAGRSVEIGFAYQNSAARVVLRAGAIDDLGAECAVLGVTRLMVVCGPRTRQRRLFARAMAALGPLAVVVFDGVVEHSSTQLVTAAAADRKSVV